MSVLDFIRPEIRSLRPYEAAEQIDDTIRLNANEAPWSGSESQFRRPLNRYPEIRPLRLRNMLAEFYDCPAERLVITRGTSEGIDLLIRVFCRADQDTLLTVSPTFSMYEHYARVQGARMLTVETSADTGFAIDVDALLQACNDSVRLIFLCSPNNPTGNSMPEQDLVRILERNPKAAVVVDEAYVEFSSRPSALRLLDKFENLIVLRTLSKALACAGARCGCVIANKPIADIVAAVQAPYALATPVVECVENALLDDGIAKASRWAREIVTERDKLMKSIAALDFVEVVWPSEGNFFLCQLRDAAAVIACCSDQGVLIRDFDKSLRGCVRITVGSPTENRRLMEVLTGFGEAAK